MGLPVGQPTITWLVKVDEIKSKNESFAYLCPRKSSLCSIISATAVVTFATWLSQIKSPIFRNQNNT